MLSKCFFHWNLLCTEDTRPHSQKRSPPMLRDRSGHSSTFTLIYSGVQMGEIRVDSHGCPGGTQGGCPGSYAWHQHSSAVCQSSQTSPSPAHTQAGSTPRHWLLISFSMQYVHDYIQNIYTQQKSAKQHCSHLKGFTFLMFLLKHFSLCSSEQPTVSRQIFFTSLAFW